MAFGDVIRSASSPSTQPFGIGGNGAVIWHCDGASDLIYELSTTDFSVVRSAAGQSNRPVGIGGDADTIWHSDNIADRIYELSTTDFSAVRSAVSPNFSPIGIGGTASVIWHSDSLLNRIYELSTTDFSVVRSASSPAGTPSDVGGDSSTIWNSDTSVNRIYELSTTDFSVIRLAAGPSASPEIGGDSRTIWLSDFDSDLIYELAVPATVTTQECINTIAEQSTGLGTLTGKGSSDVTQHGHVWATSANPTTADSKTQNGAKPNLGQFQSDITGLLPSTLYYVAAYATNGEGTGYGDDVTITTLGVIGRRHWWTEDSALHYFDEFGVERKIEGTTVTGIPLEDILTHFL